MIDGRLRALVAEQACKVRDEVRASTEGVAPPTEAPYGIYGSPMGRYWPMTRLLCDADIEALELPLFDAFKFRRERRKVYLKYVSALRRESVALLSLQVESGAADRQDVQVRMDAIRSALRTLTLAAWLHSLYVPGITGRVQDSLREITRALDYGKLLQMPLLPDTL